MESTENLKAFLQTALAIFIDGLARADQQKPGTAQLIESQLASGQVIGRLELLAPSFKVRYMLIDGNGAEHELWSLDPGPLDMPELGNPMH